MTRPRTTFVCLAYLILAAASARAQQGTKDGEWRFYGGGNGGTKYAPLDLINKDNVKNLKVAWRWASADNAILFRNPLKFADLVPFVYEATPLFVNGTLYTSTSYAQVAALDPTTGKAKWVYDPESYKDGRPTNLGFVHRGVAYWSDDKDERIFVATGNSYLIAVGAKTGKPCAEFGEKGRIDLTKGLSRPVERKLYA